MEETFRLYLFGFPRMERGGQPVSVDTRKATALLALLSINAEAMSRDSLATILWPEYDQTGARAALRRTLSVMNKAVGAGVLDIERERIGLHPGGPFWLDVRQYETGLKNAAKMPAGSLNQLNALAEVTQIYKDWFMAGFSLRDSIEFDDWQYFHAERLHRDLTRALEQLASGYAALGQYETAIGYARQLLGQDALREETHRQLMLLYARSNQRSTALRQYRECVRVLDQELGVAPLEETTALYQLILENRVTVQPVPAENVPAEIMPAETMPVVDVAPRESVNPFPLVGREAAWASLETAYASARGGGHVLVLEGEAGIGKTRLASDFLEYAESQGARTFRMRWYEGEGGLAYGPFAQALARLFSWPDVGRQLQGVSAAALAEAARLLPEINNHFTTLPVPPPLDGPGAQSRFYEGLRQVFSAALQGMQPGILFFDDLQWVDRASQDLLAYLIRRLGDSRMLVMLTLRSDASLERNPSRAVLQEAGRAGRLTRLELSRLGAADLRSLVANLAQREHLPADLVDHLFAESEGLPFFAVEYLDALRKQNGENHSWEMPASVRDLLMSRLHSVDETGGQLLSAAAVIGRSFDFLTLREVSGRSELETVAGLEELLSAGLVAEHTGSEPGQEVYDFTHEKLRDLAYEEISLARRHLLHRRVAEVLSGPGGRREPGSQAGLVAYHYRMAGNNAAAALYYQQAGDHSRQLYANTEAIEQYQAAFAAGHPEPARLHEAIGDLYTLQGDYGASIAAYETAAALCLQENVGMLERKLGIVHARRGEWDLAESHYQRALETGLSEDAGIVADRSHAAFQRGERAQARALARRSLELAQSSGDPLALAQAFNVLGMLDRAEGDLQTAVDHLQASLLAAQASGNLLAQAAALNNLALAYYDLRRMDEAIEMNRRAMQVCIQVGDRHREAALLNNLADIHHAAGREAESLEALKSAVLIFAEIGVEGTEMRPEIWKLTAW